MSKFSELEYTLEALAKQAAERDRHAGEHHQPLFDEHLFSSRPKLLTPCVHEAQATYQTMIREQQAQRLTTLRAEYLSQKLIDQIAAIKRELATQSIRRSEIKHKSYTQIPIGELYQSLAQHQQWETRLIDMVRQKEQQLQSCDWQTQASIRKELLTVEERLARCQKAKQLLEKKITYREQRGIN